MRQSHISEIVWEKVLQNLYEVKDQFEHNLYIYKIVKLAYTTIKLSCVCV